MNLSPMGFQYRYDPNGTPGQLLARKLPSDDTWGVGGRDFSIQTMTSAELRYVAGIIDDAIISSLPEPSFVDPSVPVLGGPTNDGWPPGPWVA